MASIRRQHGAMRARHAGRTLSLLLILLVFPLVAAEESYSFWDEEITVNIDALRPQRYLRCSLEALSALREAVMRPGAKDVTDHPPLTDMLRSARSQWRVTSVARNYVIPTQPVHVNALLQLECQAEGGCQELLFLLPFHDAVQASGLMAVELPSNRELRVELLTGIQDLDPECAFDSVLEAEHGTKAVPNRKCMGACYPALYRIGLPATVANGGSIKIRVDYYLGKPFLPLQRSLPFGEQQRVTFGTSSLFQCPYHTAMQRTYFSLLEELNIDIVSLHAYASLTEIKQNVFICGPFEDVELLSFGEELVISLDFHDTLEFIPSLDRVVRVPVVPLMGRITVYENYVVYNDASALEGPFSQGKIVESERKQEEGRAGLNHVGYMEALFPLGATHLRYYDIVGNISRAYRNKHSPLAQYKMVDLVPRFPLMGGWKTSFTVQYCLPQPIHAAWRHSSETDSNGVLLLRATGLWLPFSAIWNLALFVADLLGNRQQVVQVPLYPSIFYMYIHESLTMIRLPPGSKVTRVKAPVDTVYSIEPKLIKILGADIELKEVKLRSRALALHSMEHYVHEQVEVYYTRTWSWTLTVVGSALVHILCGYVILSACRKIRSFYRDLGGDNVADVVFIG